MTTLSNMIVLATNKHDGQLDKAGKPYILHPLKVMHYLKSDDDALNCMAVGHDLLEDTDCTLVDLWAAGCTKRIIEGIVALTKIKHQTPEEYRLQVLANRDACLVKLADLRHNTDIRRLKGVTTKDIERTARYYDFYTEIKNKLDNWEA